VAAVALANKLARMAWALLAKGETYRPPLVAANAVAVLRNGLQLTPGSKRQAWKSHARLPQSQTIDGGC
jgi:hypothetical protein